MTYAVAINVTKICEYLIMIKISKIYKVINVQFPTGKIVLSAQIRLLSIKTVFNNTSKIDHFLLLFQQIRLQKWNRRSNKLKRSKIKVSVHMRMSGMFGFFTYFQRKQRCRPNGNCFWFQIALGISQYANKNAKDKQ